MRNRSSLVTLGLIVALSTSFTAEAARRRPPRGKPARAQKAPPKPAAPVVGEPSQEIALAMADYKAGKLDEALGRLDRLEVSGKADPAARTKLLEIQASIYIKKKDGPGADRSYVKLLDIADTEAQYHRVQKMDEYEVLIRQNADAGTRPTDKVLQYHFQRGEVARVFTKDREVAIRSYRLAMAFGYKEDKAEEALEKLGAIATEGTSSPSKKLSFRAIAGVWLWTDVLTYTDSADKDHELLFASMNPCVGVGLSKPMGKFELSIDACFAFGSGTAGEKGGDVDYYAESVSAIGGVVSPAFLFSPARAKWAAGIEVPIVVRSVDLAAPTEAGSFLTVPSSFAFGAGAIAKYTLKNFQITARAGLGPDFGALGFGAQLGYIF